MVVRRVVCVVMDGLRPDLVRPEVMPTLWRLAQNGVWHERARTVFPSETRVATSSFSTGSYPGKHGMPGNTFYLPEVEPRKLVSAAEARRLMQLHERDGRALLATTLGEALRDAGGVLAAASSGSSGNAMLINPGAWRDETGLVVNWGVTLPESAEATLRARFGGPPAKQTPNVDVNDWIARAFCEWLIADVVAEREPAVGVLWLSEPDVSLHHRGFGSPEVDAALRHNDQILARVVDAMAAAGMRVEGADANANLMVLSDHGHTTNRPRAQRIIDEVLANGWSDDLRNGDIVHGSKTIWVKPGLRTRLPQLARQLQQHPAVGAVFARNPTGMEGVLPLSAVNHGTDRAPDVIFSPAWDDGDHPSGVPGFTEAIDTGVEVTMHGSLARFDMHTTLIGVGASFRQGVRSTVPVGLVDVAPTALHLCGAPIPANWDGRPLLEALRDGPKPVDVNVVEGSVGGQATIDGQPWQQRVQLARVGQTLYVDHADIANGARSTD